MRSVLDGRSCWWIVCSWSFEDMSHANDDNAMIPLYLPPSFVIFACRSPLDVPGGIASDQPCMTIRAPGIRLRCKVHMGSARPLRVSTLCDNVIFIGTPMTDDGNRDVMGSFLLFAVRAHSHPPPPITVATRGLLLTAREVAGNHHVTLAQEEEDVRQRLADEYMRVAAAVPQTALRNARRQAVAEKNP